MRLQKGREERERHFWLMGRKATAKYKINGDRYDRASKKVLGEDGLCVRIYV